MRRKIWVAWLLLLGVGLGWYLLGVGGQDDVSGPSGDGGTAPPLASTEPVPSVTASSVGRASPGTSAGEPVGEGVLSDAMETLIRGIRDGRPVRVKVGAEQRTYLFRPHRITAENFQISAGAKSRFAATFEVFDGREVLADGTLTGMAKLAVVNDSLAMAYSTEAGDFLIEDRGSGLLVARTLLSHDGNSTWGHFRCGGEANGLAGIVDASGDSPRPPDIEAEISLGGTAVDESVKEGARASHPYFRSGPQYDASLKDILVLMVSSKSQTGTSLSSKAATYFTYAATTADVYERQLGLRYLLQEMVLIPSNSTEDDIEPAINDPDDEGTDDLAALRTWCEAHRPQSTYQWGHAMGWTLVEGSGGGWIGWAWADRYGSSTQAYSVNEPAWTWGVHVHELGHSVGASHTIGSGGAMNPTVSRSNPQEDFFKQSENGNYTAAADIYNYMSNPNRSFVTGPAPLRNPTEMPFAVDDAVATPAETTITFNPLANDLAATPLFGQTNTQLELVEVGQVFPKAAGIATISGGGITFTPAIGFTGNAWFSYTLRGNVGNGGNGWQHAADVVVAVGGNSADPGLSPALSPTADVVEADFTDPIRINPLLNDEGRGRLWAGDVDAVISVSGTAQSYSDGALHLVGATVIAGNGTITLETTNVTRNSATAQGNSGYLVYTPGTTETESVVIEYTVADADGNQSSATITINRVDPREVLAAGTVIGSPGSYLNDPAWNKHKVFDGDLSTYYDAANPDGDWAGLDLGSARQITRIRYAPRTAWPSRMIGGQFQASPTPDFSSGVVTFHTITESPPTDILSTLAVTDSGSYRYVRYIGPNNGYCNVAEVEFFTEAAPAAPTGLVATVQANGSVNLDWDDNMEADLHSYTVYRSTVAGVYGDAHATEVLGSAYTDSTVANGTTYRYVVTAVDAEGYESVRSNEASVTPSINNFTPQVHAGPDQSLPFSGDAPWSPAQLAPAAWYDASDAATITQVGGAVSGWADKSGNGHHLGQGDASRQPQLGVNPINAITTIKFDGTNDSLISIDNPFAPAVEDALVIAVHRFDAVSSGTLFNLSGTSANPGRWQAHAPFNSTLYFDAGGTSGGARISANYNVTVGDNILVSFYGSTTDNVQQVHKNGALLVGDATGHSATVVGNMHIGSSVNAQYQNTSIGEMIIIDGTVSSENRQKLEGHLAHKWGLAGNLPGDHPYRTVAPGGSGTVANLDGTVSDADGTVPTTTWVLQSGPGAVVLADASAVDTTVTFTEPGNYVLRLTADDGAFQSFDDVTISVTTVTDSDGNGIADAWEIQYFTEAGLIDGSLDSDNDGTLDFFEYLYGSNPVNAADTGFDLTVEPSTSGSPNVVFSWEVLASFELGADYDVTISTNLQSWIPLPEGHRTLDLQPEAGTGRIRVEITLTHDYEGPVFLRLVKP